MLIGHGKGAFYAAKLAYEGKNIKGLILLSPLITVAGSTELNFDNLNEMAAKYKWDNQYLKLAMKSRMETIEKVKATKNNWAFILKTRCFLRKLREGLEENPTDIIRGVECPVLILHGKEDDMVPFKDVANFDKALEDSGNKNHKLIYYGYLGHFLGKPMDDGIRKLYYETDPAVLDTIKKWLETNA
jgi:predicted esterase